MPSTTLELDYPSQLESSADSPISQTNATRLVGALWKGIRKSSSTHTNRPHKARDVEEALPMETLSENSNNDASKLLMFCTNQDKDRFIQRGDLASPSITWYLKYLWTELEKIPTEALDEIFESNQQITPHQRLDVFYDILLIVSTSVTEEKYISVDGIVDQLRQLDSIRKTTKSCFLREFVFRAVGWLTMFYSSSGDFKDRSRFRICQAHDSYGNPLESEYIFNYSQPVHEYTSTALYQLLRRFGSLVPHFRTKNFAEFDHGEPTPLYTNILTVANLSYHVLKKLANVQIEWVDSLSYHLDFDERSGVLKVFRFPSFCALVFYPGYIFVLNSDKSMSRLLVDNMDDDETGIHKPNASEYFMEVLVSYRVLFGQDDRAWSLFMKEYKKLKGKAKDLITEDPLLLGLCSKNWKKQILYTEVRAKRPKALYSAKKDFPHLGRRLLDLQTFVVAQNPKDLNSLWHDRRDMLRFYTIWAVLIIGGLSLLLSFLSVALSVAQVVAVF